MKTRRRSGVVSRRPVNRCNADWVTADRTTVADKLPSLPAANGVPLLTFSPGASVTLMNFFDLHEESRRPPRQHGVGAP